MTACATGIAHTYMAARVAGVLVAAALVIVLKSMGRTAADADLATV